MSERSCKYVVSPRAKELLGGALMDQMVGVVVDRAYEANLNLAEHVFTHRLNLFFIDGKKATGGELIEAAKTRPADITQELPIVGLYEEKGEDMAYIILQSDIESAKYAKTLPREIPDEMRELLSTPPSVTVDQLIEEVKRNS